MATRKPGPSLPNRIREWRKKSGLTLVELAELAGTSKGHVSKLELGDRELTQTWMKRIATALGLAPADLLPESEGGLSEKARHIVRTYQEIPAGMRAAIEAVAESQQPFRGFGEVVPLHDRPARDDEAKSA